MLTVNAKVEDSKRVVGRCNDSRLPVSGAKHAVVGTYIIVSHVLRARTLTASRLACYYSALDHVFDALTFIDNGVCRPAHLSLIHI